MPKSSKNSQAAGSHRSSLRANVPSARARGMPLARPVCQHGEVKTRDEGACGRLCTKPRGGPNPNGSPSAFSVWQWQSETSEDSSERPELIYEELIRTAGHCLRRERHRTLLLEPADLVHEAYLRIKENPVQYLNRKHFFGIWSRVMRQILIDASRRAHALKRSGARQRVDLNQVDLLPQAARESAGPR